MNKTCKVEVLTMRDSGGTKGPMLKPYDHEARHVASSKGFTGECGSEVSWTANTCTEEHELHMRHRGLSRWHITPKA